MIFVFIGMNVILSDVNQFIESIYNFVNTIIKILEELIPILEKYLYDSNLYYNLSELLEILKNSI